MGSVRVLSVYKKFQILPPSMTAQFLIVFEAFFKVFQRNEIKVSQNLKFPSVVRLVRVCSQELRSSPSNVTA